MEANMTERFGLVTFRGHAITLVGHPVGVDDKAPDFLALANDMTEVKFSSFKDKVRIISAVPSLDTPICDLQTRRFNQEASALGDGVKILTISMDLPFAQKRWCAATGADNLITLSDHRDASFGITYGLLIKELRLLARAVYVIDKKGFVSYCEIVKEIASEPNYDAVLEVARAVLKQ